MSYQFIGALQGYLSAGQGVVLVPPFSIGAWINTADDSWQAIASIADKDAAMYNALGVNDWKGRAASYWLTVAEAVSTTTFSTGVWAYVLGMWETTSKRSVLLNNAGLGENTGLKFVSNIDEFTIGVTADSSPSNFFTGYIAEVAIWNKILSNEESRLLAEAIYPNEAVPSGLVAYYPLAADCLDHKGSYDMTAHGGAYVSIPFPAKHKPQVNRVSGVRIYGRNRLSSLRRSIF